MKYGKNRPEKKLVINVPPIMQRLSTFELLKRTLWYWLDRKTIKKTPVKDPAAGMPNMHDWTSISHFAIVVGEDVVDVMRVQPKMATWLQSNPRFVMFDPQQEFSISPGFKYVNDKFIDPNLNLDLKPQKMFMKDKDEE